MAFEKITETDLKDKGVIGLPDVPGLSADQMQRKFEEVSIDVIVPKFNQLVDDVKVIGEADLSITPYELNGNTLVEEDAETDLDVKAFSAQLNENLVAVKKKMLYIASDTAFSGEMRDVYKPGWISKKLCSNTADAMKTVQSLAEDMCVALDALYTKLGATNISTIGDGTVTGAISTVNGYFSYNETEVACGTWIDGRTIYKKSIVYENTESIGDASGVADITIAHNISGLASCIKAELCAYGNYIFPYHNSAKFTGIVNVTSNHITLRIINDTWSANTWIATLYYVKST